MMVAPSPLWDLSIIDACIRCYRAKKIYCSPPSLQLVMIQQYFKVMVAKTYHRQTDKSHEETEQGNVKEHIRSIQKRFIRWQIIAIECMFVSNTTR